MKKEDYIDKMMDILQDPKKLKWHGDCATHDWTVKVEIYMQALLQKLNKTGEIPDYVYERIRPTGSTRPRLYGLPKVHQPGAPLRPILVMVGSGQHATAQWLAEVLEPVLERYSTFVLKDSFEFSDLIKEFSPPVCCFMCPYDIIGLFTNILVDETIDICADALYRSDAPLPSLKEGSFHKLIQKVTCRVEFSFNDVLYQQVDRVSVGSPLGPVFTNIIVGYYEQNLDINNDLLCRRSVDGTFRIN